MTQHSASLQRASSRAGAMAATRWDFQAPAAPAPSPPAARWTLQGRNALVTGGTKGVCSSVGAPE